MRAVTDSSRKLRPEADGQPQVGSKPQVPGIARDRRLEAGGTLGLFARRFRNSDLFGRDGDEEGGGTAFRRDEVHVVDPDVWLGILPSLPE